MQKTKSARFTFLVSVLLALSMILLSFSMFGIKGSANTRADVTESGGHIGETTTMALVPQVADAVKIPVIAAGGIADGRGMAAAFMLGAEAVQMGTRFVASKEAVVHENYKQLVIKAKDIDTRVTGRTTGHPVRAIRND